MEEPARNHSVKQTTKRIHRDLSTVFPSVDTACLKPFLSWDCLDNKIISVVAARLTACIKAPHAPSSDEEGHWHKGKEIHPSTQRSTLMTYNTSASSIKHTKEEDEGRQEKNDENIMRMEAQGWAEEKKTKYLPVWGSSLQLPPLWSQQKKRKKKKVTEELFTDNFHKDSDFFF